MQYAGSKAEEAIMKPILTLYATREGYTRRIAEYLAVAIGARGMQVDALDAAYVPARFSLEGYSAAIICASVHRGRHEPELIRFVKRNASGLEHIPTAFLSVSLSQAGAEDAAASAGHRFQAATDVKEMIEASNSRSNGGRLSGSGL
jgi:menaquinone-dependent protoporphyrinogen IX oxidase